MARLTASSAARRATSGRRPRAARARSAGPAARPRVPLAGRFQRSARSGANVSFVTSPAQTRSHRASSTSRSEPPPAARVQLAVERRAARGQVLADRARGASPAARSTPSGGPTGPERLAARPDEHDPAVVAAEAPPPHPGDLAHRAELVEQARLVARDPGRQHVPLQDRRRDRQAGQLVDDLGQALQGGRPAERRRGRSPTAATPCHAGRNRASAAGSTGSTSRRSRASDRRRSSRSTSGSHHSRSAPPGRNSPRSSVPAASSRSSASSTTPTGRPQRRAGSGVRNGPCVRAQRASSPSSAPATGARNASGTPDRRRHADAVAVAGDVLDRDPALLAGDPGPDRAPRRTPAPRATDAAHVAPPSTRAATSSVVRSPSRRSRSWTWSAVVAWRSSASAWRVSSRSASASGSSSSRSSSWPSSSRSRSRSSVSACARRSASGASPSYM